MWRANAIKSQREVVTNKLRKRGKGDVGRNS